ncbi:hypothetical protein GCM10009557_66160 [Virgisporangium ochraceum]|uniref:Uncharacterized protein n=1 Tax=Virgisporangium ochraceum TaxID=65505 RepID=A0A8J3ZPP0_9ACTN|nr:hypothetical protein [Virgisporangium ochraceum]GIJ65270.1 hypothetical protein Voc01_001870 [Virgisporangium ochraceum]
MTAADISFTEYAKFVFPETFAKGVAAGQAKGKAESLLAILGARGVTVPDEARERITSCTDIEQLDTWIVRAATAIRIDDLSL